MKLLILFAFIAILGALGAAGFFMLRNGRRDKRGPQMARALALRVGLSVALFLVILLCWAMGWIQPTGLPLQR
ncbi:MAG: twin transmembrane helix small protein [Roseateles depolymerans]|uniref:Twin transmembrane helix small protein n=1 Tax=Roseateles depolymerans TaxID=76731 RepID=A0A2W5DH38_9BURK|nr:MAG: twin transmembrane helix small protein [Roseateles depolymerans]